MLSTGLLCRELIGRTSELAFVLDRVRVLGERSSATIVVRGEAGIGKSRLVDEAVRAARDEGYRAAVGSTREYANAPYAALDEVLEQLGVELVADVDVDDGAVDAKMRRFSAVAESIAIAGAAAGRGLLIAVEDLHWADLGTLELLRFLARRLAARAVTFIVTYRADEIEADSARARSILALERDAQAVVTLSPLPSQQIERLIASVIRSGDRTVSPAVVSEIRDLSDGRPLFAEELLRGVFERLDRDVDAVPTVPASIRVAVNERYASLTETDRAILLHAALIGRRFSARFVAAFAGHDLLSVYAALRRARDLQLVVEQPGEADAFAFRHALTREAIYAQMLRAEAQLMHAKVAQALIEEPQADAAAIADHLWHAGDAQAAAHWSDRAGDEAYAVFAYSDAARAYERAYRLGADARRAYRAERAADSWYALGDLAQSVEWFGRAAEAHDAAGQPRLARRLALRKARSLFEGGRYEAGLRAADELTTTEHVEPELRFEAELMVAGLLTVNGRASEALARLTRAEALGIQPDPFVKARFSGTFATALSYLGRADEARPRFATAISQARENGDYDQLLRSYNNWANLELGYGTVGRAHELYLEAIAVAAHTKISRVSAWVMMNDALCAVLVGDLDRATDLLARVAEIEHGVNVVHRWSVALALQLGTMRGRPSEGDLERARGELDESIDDVHLPSISVLAGAIAYRLAAEHRIAEAGDVLGRVLPIFNEVEIPYWLVDAASLYGDGPTRVRARELAAAVAARAGARPAQGMLAVVDAREALRRRRREESQGLAEVAVAAFRDAGWTLHEAHALELAGRVAEALALFRRMGATGEVARITHVGALDQNRRRGDATLTGREREIAGLVVAGLQTKAIADRLVISERTVESHLAAVYRKLGVTNRRALETLLSGSPDPKAP